MLATLVLAIVQGVMMTMIIAASIIVFGSQAIRAHGVHAVVLGLDSAANKVKCEAAATSRY